VPFRESQEQLPNRINFQQPEDVEAPSFASVAGASFVTDNTVVNAVRGISDEILNPIQPDPDYDVAQDPRLEKYSAYADNLVHAESEQELLRMTNRIDEELEAKRIIAESDGLDGFAAAAIVAVTDPISWVPVGGAAFKTYKTGGTLLNGAARTATAGAAIETGSEVYLQAAQQTRTTEQSAGNIAATTLLSGVLGGAASSLSLKQQADISAKIDAEMDINTPNEGLSTAGAMQAGTTLEQEGIKGLKKTQKVFEGVPDFLKSPVYRNAVASSKVVRQINEKLGDLSLVRNKNTEGIASAVSVETKVKAYDALKAVYYRDTFNPQYKAYRKRVAKGEIEDAERIGSRKNGTLTYKEFSEEVTKANRRNDSHVIPEVQASAQGVRRDIFDPLKQRNVDVGIFDEFDIDVKTADSWARRIWDRDQILNRREEFKRRNLEWLRAKNEGALDALENFKAKYAEEIKAKNNKILDELETLKARVINQERDADYLDGIADQLIDNIVGLPGGRIGYDVGLDNGPSFKGKNTGARGAAKKRVYDIPDEMVEDFLVNDVHAIISSHVRTTAADAELMDTFGTLDLDVLKREVAEDYAQLINKEKGNPKKVAKLEKEKRQSIEDINTMWERTRGTFAQPDDYAAAQHVANRAALALNYARLLGGMTVSAIPDMGRHVMVHGMSRTMNDGIMAMVKDFKGYKYAVEDVREAAVGLDITLSTTALTRANMDEFTPTGNKVDAVSSAVSDGFNVGSARVPSFGTLTGMNHWNTGQKTFAGVMTQTRMMRAIQDIGAGKTIDAKEIENLASHGIDLKNGMAKRIAEQFKKHGDKRENVLIPNARSWDDKEAANIFRSAVRKQVDETIVTPGQDRPTWMSKPGWNLVGQFRSFGMSSMQRVTMAGLQQGDAQALSGVMSMIAMGSMVYGIKTIAADREVSDDPRVWLSEGIDRSGITGWFFDVNNISEKATRGTVGVNSLIGGPQMSRYASRNVTGSILGPTFGMGQDIFNTTGAIGSGEWSESDTRAMRRLMPYQNVIYLRSLFDKVENGANEALGVQ